MIVHEGLIAAFNYAVGPALIYEGPATLDIVTKTGDPYILIVPDTIPLQNMFTTDARRLRGFVLAHCEKDSVFTTFVITQRRASVRCVPGILDDIKEGRLKNGDLIAVDGVNGKVFVQPDEATINFYESMRGTGQPEITKAHLPRIAREAMQTANVPVIPPMPTLPPMPDMITGLEWPGMEKAKGHIPDMPTPAEVRREITLSIKQAEDAHKLAILKTWQSMAFVAVTLHRDGRLDPDEAETINKAVEDELARLDALKPPPPPPKPESEKTRAEKWGLSPLAPGERDPNEVALEEAEAEEAAKKAGKNKPAPSRSRERATATATTDVKAIEAPKESEKAELAAAPAMVEEKAEAPKSAAESRRAQREAEIAKARAAREGGKEDEAK